MRKIIQISTTRVSAFEYAWVITALCDDGTVWFKRNNDNYWHLLVSIPQSEIDEEAFKFQNESMAGNVKPK